MLVALRKSGDIWRPMLSSDPFSDVSSTIDEKNFSSSGFALCIALIIFGFIAFPLFQAIQTGGVLFYANAIDESGYLSYQYSTYSAENSSMHRLSSFLVLWLHRLGLSGGYCNVLFDVVSTVGILVGLYRLLHLMGYCRADARSGALLIFILPLAVGPTNPIFEHLRWTFLSESLVRWMIGPFNPELPFARSPEPQLSWLLIVLWLNLFFKSRWLLISAFFLSPFLYSFIRLPFLFTVIAIAIAKQVNLYRGILLAFLLVGAMVASFSILARSGPLAWLTVRTWLPMLSLMGVTSYCIYVIIRDRAPQWMRTIGPVLVASTWVGPNVQIISGTLAAPVNYEQYWSNVVIGLLAAVGILSINGSRRLWVGAALVIFAIQSAKSFDENRRMFAELPNRDEALVAIKTASERVAVNDVLLASYLDLSYPMQPSTLFSFNSTYNLKTEALYHRYSCGRRYIEANTPDIARSFTSTFARLDYAYQAAGVDLLNTAGRAETPKRPLSPLPADFQCPTLPPLVFATASP